MNPTALVYLDYFGIAVFAVSGALLAAEKRQTLVTFFFFAVITGVGGGTIRDLLIGAPVFWVHSNIVLLTCIAAGLARLLALAVNGTFANTAYSRYSPHVRGVTAIASAAFWFMVLLSVSAVATAGNRIYPLPLALELWCIFHAWRDTGRAKAARDGLAH